MNNKVNYTFVGILVLVGIFFIMAFSYWMMQPSSEIEEKKYSIYFDESVLGLNIDAPVKYRGISVGKVSKMQISEKNSEQIKVTIVVLKTTPIKVDTVAKLTSQGITGLTYINLSQGSHMAKDLVCLEDEDYPVIQTVPSFFENIEQSLGSVSTQLSATLGRTTEMLGEDNQRNLSLLLSRTASILDKVDTLLDEKTIKHLQNSAKNLDSLSHKIDSLVPNIDHFIVKSEEWEDKLATSFAGIEDSYVGITGSMAEIQRAVASGEFNIKAISADIVPSMNNALIEMQEMMIKFEDMLEQYSNSPADILYKREEMQRAPGEEE